MVIVAENHGNFVCDNANKAKIRNLSTLSDIYAF
mgnify:CR=1 FL=1|jgi:hypothetical protein